MTKPKIVNVASVRKLSPFRYPGGKTWLVPYARTWLKGLKCKPEHFIEPFVGGGIISLTVGFDSLAANVTMVELDEEVAAVWQTALSDKAPELCKKILEFDLTVDNVRAALAGESQAPEDVAFRTILKNRTFHGGILAKGSSMIKHGESGKGIASRWYAKTLADRITDIYRNRQPFQFIQGNGIEVMKTFADNDNAAFFIDPPYTAGKKGKRAGNRLYTHSQIDHDALFDAAKSVKGDFLMTYDNDPEVLDMAKARGFDTDLIPMKNTHHAEMTELVIGRDLEWVRRMKQSKPTTPMLFE